MTRTQMATLALVAVVATGCGSAQPSSLSSLGFSSSGTPSPSAAEETPSEVAPSSPTAVPTAAAPAATFAGLPPKGTFSSPVSFVYPSQEYSATLFKDGRVLIAGGAGSTSGSYTWATLSVARLYSPADGAWVTPGKMTSVRQCHTATLLEDGRVLIAGGWTGSPDYTTLSSAEIYDPVTGQFSPTGAMATARCRAQAVRLADGRVLIAGGQSAGVYGLNTAEIYDPGTGKFSPTGPFATNYVEQCACDLYSLTVLGDGRVLMLGNVKPTDAQVAPNPAGAEGAQIYDPATNTFSMTGDPLVIGPSLTVVLLDGRVLDISDTADIFDPTNGTFSATGKPNILVQTATRLADGRVLVTGTLSEAGRAEIYDPATGRFTTLATKVATTISVADTPPITMLLPDGCVLFLWGQRSMIFRP